MRQSQLFCYTSKIASKEAQAVSHKLLVRADFVSQLASGVYSFLPLGLRVHRKIEQIIREEMTTIGGQELYLPILVPKNLWMETKRWDSIDPPLYKLKDRSQAEFGLGSTHEEVVTDLVRQRVKSYKDLPLYLFQIQDKFRNELRATSGLLRVKEFVMKDLYSFNASRDDALEYYQKVRGAYLKIFKRCGLQAISVEADPGTIGGELSHEFMVLSETGEDKILRCRQCNFAGNISKFKDTVKCPECRSELSKFSAIESGHTFYLGTKYSEVMGANFIDKNGKTRPIIMGCYGIGLGRLMATIVEVHHDSSGIIWPKEAAPFGVHLIAIPAAKSRPVEREAENLYRRLQQEGIEVLYDDRKGKTAGEKFADADLIGIPIRIVVSQRTIKESSAEMKMRSQKTTKLMKIKSLPSLLLKPKIKN